MDVLESITTTPTCSTCRYYEPAEDPIDEPLTYGACRRYPKAIDVAHEDWCGEHAHG